MLEDVYIHAYNYNSRRTHLGVLGQDTMITLHTAHVAGTISSAGG